MKRIDVLCVPAGGYRYFRPCGDIHGTTRLCTLTPGAVVDDPPGVTVDAVVDRAIALVR